MVGRALGILLLLGACNGPKPTAQYPHGHVLIVLDTSYWSGALGDALREVLASPVPYLPQYEPLFSVLRADVGSFNNALRHSASILLVAHDDSPRAGALRRLAGSTADGALLSEVVYYDDVYATSQRVALALSPDTASLIALLRAERSRIRLYFERHEKALLSGRLGLQAALRDSLHARHGVRVPVPRGWVVAKELGNATDTMSFVWLRNWDNGVDKNIFMYSAPYRDSAIWVDPLSYRESIASRYLVDGEKNQLYSTLQPEWEVLRTETRFQDRYALMMRGLWKLSDSSIGGPFLSYVVLNSAEDRVYYTEAFVYSPGKEKRDVMRGLEVVLTGIGFP